MPRPVVDQLLDMKKLRAHGRRLVRWYESHGRDLPWRHCRDPYGVWVSEIMLQQTTVAAVTPRWGRFMKRFPNVTSLARAPEEDVLAELQGLGYYRRFRAMKKAAEILASEGGSRCPSRHAEWLSLPGIGEYTAGAIMSIAFNEACPAVDGNVIRVLSRLFSLPGNHESVRARRRLGEIVRAMMPKGRAGHMTQGLFDLGATICLPRSPLCGECPLKSACLALAHDRVEDFPEKAPRKAMKDVGVAVALIERRGRVLMVPRPEDAPRMPGFLELPEVWLKDDEDPSTSLKNLAEERLGTAADIGEVVARCRHTITHHRLFCQLFDVDLEGSAPEPVLWIDPETMEGQPVSTISRKLLRNYRAAAT